ncbi:J domain-containing protein [Diaphorobacter sp.]|uniref:J domain-containing protein n=1 Tax=Diaphorobacter sp. TaxID=1934310 RepID=UPI003D0B5C3A
MTSSCHAPVRIPAAPGGAPLTAQQKKFNRHIERIAQQRELLAQWQQAIADYHERYAREIQPAQDGLRALLVELVEWLDTTGSARKLTKADQRTLSEAIADRLGMLIDATPDEATRERLKEIYNRHSGGDYDAEEAQDQETARDMAQAIARDLFGVDLQDADMESPDAILRRVHEQMQARQEQAGQERQAHHAARARKPSAQQRKAQEAAAQATQSVREIYRKLASQLHPDREPDPAGRERKTALMQRVNQAYAGNRLLDLLQLQLEVEQIDPGHIAGLSEERLAHYNRMLARQLGELQQEVQEVQQQFMIPSGMGMGRNPSPASLTRELRAYLATLQAQTLGLRKEINALRADPAALKDWLKAERRQQKERDALDAQDAIDEPGPWF